MNDRYTIIGLEENPLFYKDNTYSDGIVYAIRSAGKDRYGRPRAYIWTRNGGDEVHAYAKGGVLCFGAFLKAISKRELDKLTDEQMVGLISLLDHVG